MLNTLSARATFYDIIGYFVPGMLACGIVLIWLNVLGGEAVIDCVCELANGHWFAASIVGVSLSYVAGHCANSCSSWLLEKHIYQKRFATAANWHKRLLEKSPEREGVIKSVVDAEFGLDIAKLKPFDLLIRMEEFLPQATMSGFSFLCFYGMCRTLALLAWLAAIPVGVFMGMKWGGGCIANISAGVVTGVLMCAVGALFVNQYLRFVCYYYDFLGSTLMFSVGKIKVPGAN